MASKKILMLVGDFTEEYEIFVFQQGMEAVGHTVHVVCPDKKAGDILRTSLHDFEGDQTYTEKLGHNFVINKSFGKVDPADYDAVYCAGGRGPEYIRTDKRVQALVRHFHEAQKPIFTICHGVQILIAVDGVVRGKKVAALGACEPEVTLAGGTYIDLSPTEAYVDGTMVSAKGWTALAAFMRECLKVLGTRIVHEDVVSAAAPAARKRSAKSSEPVSAKAAKPAKAPKKDAAAPKRSAPARRSRKSEAVATP
ncbi:protease I [Kaistia hirudinis]|uniref:Protease I n=1 Tax=Kaistia hirudinis TaxID=1293440 RepID=A0A840AKE9_9HYPH|nr:protease I [Kaistia hirudinis]